VSTKTGADPICRSTGRGTPGPHCVQWGSGPRLLPSLPEEPIQVATVRDAQLLIAEVFQCENGSTIGDVNQIGDNLEDFEQTFAEDSHLLAITADNEYVFVSPNGKDNVYAHVLEIDEPTGGGLMGGCVN
jgi:hypothetical protein